mmetsp:Transcript_71386/g.209254  ORF Transcript_71386/g.209254 Transcript_71386/m.209254 type:complete len:365 (+) Transcript_71386:80-1174(+)
MPAFLASLFALACLATQATALRTTLEGTLAQGRTVAKPATNLKVDWTPEMCAVERGAFHEQPPDPPARLLQLTSALHASSAPRRLERTGRNYSFVRTCKTSKDKLRALGPLLLPERKLAFCYVAKTACTQFKDLFNFLNNFSNKTLGYGHNYLASMPRAMHISPQNITKENGWKFAVFTRDPLLRYLSAFGSSCVSNGRHFEHKFECCGKTVSNRVSQEKMVKHFEERVRYDSTHGLVKEDDHWVEQTEFLRNCGWEKFRPENLDFRGHLSGDVNGQVKEMLRLVNYANDTVVDRFFPHDRIAGHRNPMKISAAEDFYKDPEILKAAMKLFEDDYERLPGVGCSFTEWMLKRTGLKQDEHLKQR